MKRIAGNGTDRSRGFLLIEAMIAIALLSIVAMWQANAAIEKFRESTGKIIGGQLKTVGDGLGAYAVVNSNAVINNTAITGVANVRQPTVAELVALGFLPTTASSTGLNGGAYRTLLSVIPAGCVSPNCNVDGYVLLDKPLTITGTAAGTPVPAMIGEAMTALGADGGVSTLTPNLIQGAGSAWTMPNPLGNVSGTLAYRVGTNSSAWSQMLRRDGTLPMTGTLNMGGQTVINVGSKSINAACATTGEVAQGPSGELLSCQGGQWKQQGSMYWKDAVSTFGALPISGDPTGAVRTTTDTGRAFMWTGAGWAPLAVDQDGNLNVPSTLTAANGKVVAWNNAPEGGVVQLNGANNVKTFLQNLNGKFRVVNDPWNKELFSIDQSGNVDVSARMSADTMLPKKIVVANTACSTNGEVARDSNGKLFSCQSGIWKNATLSGGRISSSDLTGVFCPAKTVPQTGWRLWPAWLRGYYSSNYILDSSCNLYFSNSGFGDTYLGTFPSGSSSFTTATVNGTGGITFSLTTAGLQIFTPPQPSTVWVQTNEGWLTVYSNPTVDTEAWAD